jgi:O-antigen/teichoic acid export membrane protein
LTELADKAKRGFGWSLLGTLGTRAGSFLMNLVLARLLVPEDFGVFAVAMAAWAFLIHINDVGLIAATVQWRGKLDEMAPTATVVAAVSSATIYGAFWMIVPSFAHLAGSDGATPVIRLLSAVIVIDGLTAVRSGALMRRFEQDKLIKANLAGLLVNAPIAITLALTGAGAFSFAWGQVAASAVTGVLVFVSARVPVRIGFDREIAAKLLRFGLPLAASLGIESILMNADYVIVGHVLGTAAVGFYMLAFNVSSWVPGLIGTAIRYVSVAGFSRLAEDDDPESLSLGVQRSVPLLVSFVLPVAVVMMTLASPLVVFLYGAKWAAAATVLSFLSVLMVVRMLTSLVFDILTSAGATRGTVWLNLGWVVALVPALLVGVHLDGIRGVGMGHAIVAVLVALPLALVALHRAGVRLGPAIPSLVRPALGAALTALVIVALSRVTSGIPFVQLCVAGGAGLVVYVLVVVRRDQFRWLGGLRSKPLIDSAD